MYSEKHTIKNIKSYLKNIAKRITILKQLRKMECNQNLKGFDPKLVDEVKDLVNKSYSENYLVKVNSKEFRHYHIAYCEFRGKTRKQIENKVSEVTLLYYNTKEEYIKEIKEKMTHDMEELKLLKGLSND